MAWMECHDLGTRMAVIEKGFTITNRLTQAATQPQNENSIRQASKALSDAKKYRIRIDPNVIKDTGEQFIGATAAQPLAQQAVQQYLDYRSFLNRELAPSGPLEKKVNIAPVFLPHLRRVFPLTQLVRR